MQLLDIDPLYMLSLQGVVSDKNRNSHFLMSQRLCILQFAIVHSSLNTVKQKRMSQTWQEISINLWYHFSYCNWIEWLDWLDFSESRTAHQWSAKHSLEYTKKSLFGFWIWFFSDSWKPTENQVIAVDFSCKEVLLGMWKNSAWSKKLLPNHYLRNINNRALLGNTFAMKGGRKGSNEVSSPLFKPMENGNYLAPLSGSP